ncbi:hypothetical protein U1Q18_048952, partial [Sarracenia purpurea var. burkii]
MPRVLHPFASSATSGGFHLFEVRIGGKNSYCRGLRLVTGGIFVVLGACVWVREWLFCAVFLSLGAWEGPKGPLHAGFTRFEELRFHPYSVAGIFGATSDQQHVSTIGILVDSSCIMGFYELSFVAVFACVLPMRLATAVSSHGVCWVFGDDVRIWE